MHEFTQLGFSPEPQGLALVLKQPWLHLDQVRLNGPSTWLGIESSRNPGNLGTILRAAKACGAEGLMVFGNRGQTADVFDPQVIRASMGAALQLRFVRTTYRELERWSYRSEIRVIGADAAGTLDYRQVKFRRPVLIMLGDERSGLSPGQTAACDVFARLPMARGVDSINVAMAATVLLYEAYGQKHPLRNC